jgi:hypothetical protein
MFINWCQVLKALPSLISAARLRKAPALRYGVKPHHGF